MKLTPFTLKPSKTLVRIEAARTGEENSLPKVTMNAYNGGLMNIKGYPYPLVLDIQGGFIENGNILLLRDHDEGKVVGHATEDQVQFGSASVDIIGLISATNEHAEDVASSSINGLPWQSSVGAMPRKLKFIKPGQTAMVNGKSFKGPFYLVEKWVLRESSFVAFGADRTTKSTVQANAVTEGQSMFKEWLLSKGYISASEDELTTGLLKTMQAQFDKEQNPEKEKPTEKKVEAKADDSKEGEGLMTPEQIKATMQKSHDEIMLADANLKAACGDDQTRFLKAKAEGWSEDKAKYETLQATYSKAPNINVVSGDTSKLNATHMEAAIALASSLDGIEGYYDEKVLDAADGAFKGGMGIEELFGVVARHNGYTGNVYSFSRDAKAIFAAAHGRGLGIKANYSTISVSGILGNIGNKNALNGWNYVEHVWKEICAIGSTTNFKEVTSFRLGANLELEEIGPGGKIKHGSLDEESYKNQAKSYAKMLAITFQDIVNDDLHMITNNYEQFGIGSGEAFNKIFWRELMDNATHLAATIEGVTGIEMLSAIKMAFSKIKKPNGNPAGARAWRWIVPTGIEDIAHKLYNDSNLIITGQTDVQMGSSNPHKGKYKPVSTDYLSREDMPNHSEVASLMIPNPKMFPVIQALFLNNQQTPLIETAESDFNQLGMQARAQFHFGIKKQTKMIVKATGAPAA